MVWLIRYVHDQRHSAVALVNLILGQQLLNYHIVTIGLTCKQIFNVEQIKTIQLVKYAM